ncbi:MAG: glutamate-5-semialdehyde dehydrogenase, partial [Terriglobales bacterium]
MNDKATASTGKNVAQHESDHEDVMTIATSAKLASARLPGLTAQQRKQALLNAVAELSCATKEIIGANKVDLEQAQAQLKAGKLSQALFARLKLDESKLQGVLDGMRSIAEQPDQLGGVELATELDEGLELYKIVCPVGVIAVIFESRPDALPQIASLCLKSGNAVILKGGREAMATNRVLYQCILRGAVKAGVPKESLVLLETREAIAELLKADGFVDLIIPRGGNDLVRHIQDNTRIPVLGHAEGLCHLYIDADADQEMAVRIAVDAKAQYPAACNAIETILVDEPIAKEFLPKLVPALHDAGVEVRADDQCLAFLSDK